LRVGAFSLLLLNMPVYYFWCAQWFLFWFYVKMSLQRAKNYLNMK